jgi:hypothetical protein
LLEFGAGGGAGDVDDFHGRDTGAAELLELASLASGWRF